MRTEFDGNSSGTGIGWHDYSTLSLWLDAMNLSDPSLLVIAAARYKALTSISSHYRTGYQRAGFAFDVQPEGIHLQHSGQTVVVMPGGFTRADVLTGLQGSVKDHTEALALKIRDQLKARLDLPEYQYVHVDLEYDLPRLVSTEKTVLVFRVRSVMGKIHGSVVLGLADAHMSIQAPGHEEYVLVKADTYQALIDSAINAYNDPSVLVVGSSGTRQGCCTLPPPIPRSQQ